MNMMEKEQFLEPILKWPGGKQDELNVIVPSLPTSINSYFEPFVGGGAVYLTIPSYVPAFVNDKSQDLIILYRSIANQSEIFFSTLNSIFDHWQLIEHILSENFNFLLERYCNHRGNVLNDYQIFETVDQFILSNEKQLHYFDALQLSTENNSYIKLIRDSLYNKISRMLQLERKKGQLADLDIRDNLEGALKAAFYYYLRDIYNRSAKIKLEEGQQAAVFFFVRENAYASMFRFNKNGDFNIPYGGISYNRKNLKAKVERLKEPQLRARLANTTFANLDFADFLALYPPVAGDFIFLDPPYDSEFSNYDKSPFRQSDQERLANFLINECEANFMLVIKSTPFILSLYENQSLKIDNFGKKYMYTVKERNNRDVTHLLITNY